MRIFALCLTLLVSVTGFAGTETTKDRARRLYESGVTHFQVGKLDKAIEEFEESFELLRQPEILYNLGQAHRLLGNYKQALYYYKSFLVVANITDGDRATVSKRITDLETQLASQNPRKEAVTQPSPASEQSVSISTESAHAPPHARTESIAKTPTAPQATIQLQPIIISTPSPAAEAERAVPPYRSAAGWTLLSLGLVVGGVGAGLLGYSPTLQSEANHAMSVAELESDTNAYNNVRIAGCVVTGVGILLTLGSVTAFSVSAFRYQHQRGK